MISHMELVAGASAEGESRDGSARSRTVAACDARTTGRATARFDRGARPLESACAIGPTACPAYGPAANCCAPAAIANTMAAGPSSGKSILLFMCHLTGFGDRRLPGGPLRGVPAVPQRADDASLRVAWSIRRFAIAQDALGRPRHYACQRTDAARVRRQHPGVLKPRASAPASSPQSLGIEALAVPFPCCLGSP